MTTCPGHQFNVMLDEAVKQAFILDNGGLLSIPKDKTNIMQHLKEQGFKTSYHQVKFKDDNNFVSCVNQSQVMMEKLCRWFEIGDMYKNPSKQTNDTKFIPETITGEELVDKINQTHFSVASNINKINGRGVGSGYSLNITNMNIDKSNARIELEDKKITHYNTIKKPEREKGRSIQ
jgi:hypothetical protein